MSYIRLSTGVQFVCACLVICGCAKGICMHAREQLSGDGSLLTCESWESDSGDSKYLYCLSHSTHPVTPFIDDVCYHILLFTNSALLLELVFKQYLCPPVSKPFSPN